ncbi:MAG TPA: hypothetical protein VK427_24975 [Kofleriaceae bacterium]|nr:hypothetical protein [Kofleriaceae bacterium]
MKRLCLLVLLSGCLDSLVDNPCEDGYTLSGEGECVVEQPKTTTPPPVAEQPTTPTEPVPPTRNPEDVITPPPDSVDPIPPGTPPTDGLSPCPLCH